MCKRPVARARAKVCNYDNAESRLEAPECHVGYGAKFSSLPEKTPRRVVEGTRSNLIDLIKRSVAVEIIGAHGVQKARSITHKPFLDVPSADSRRWQRLLFPDSLCTPATR